MFKYIVRFLIALLIGSFFAIWIAQNNQALKKTLATRLVTLLEKEWQAHVAFSLDKINFFTGSCFIEKGKIKSLKHQTHWSFDYAKISLSLWQLLFYKKIALSFAFNGVHVFTRFDNDKIDFINHITDMFDTPVGDVSVDVETVKVANVHLDIDMLGKRVTALFPGGTFNLTNKNNLQGLFSLQQGQLVIDGKLMLTDIVGKVAFDRVQNNLNFSFDHSFDYVWYFNKPRCRLHGVWNDKERKIQLSQQDKLLDLALTSLEQNEGKIGVSGLLDLPVGITLYQNLLSKQQEQSNEMPFLKGQCKLDFYVEKKKQGLCAQGEVVVDDFAYKQVSLGTCKCAPLKVDAQALSTNILAKLNSVVDLSGTFKWDMKQESGLLMLTNATSLAPFVQDKQKVIHHSAAWVVQPRDFIFKTVIDQKEDLRGSYKLFLSHEAQDEVQSFEGTYLVNKEKLFLEGKTAQGLYQLEACHSPDPYLSKLYYAGKKDVFIDMKQKDSTKKVLEGSLHYSLIQSLLTQQAKRLILGRQNVLYLVLDQSDVNKISGKIKLQKGKFYIPENRNLIEKFSTSFLMQPFNKRFELHNVAIGFCKGSIRCPRAVFTFDDSFKFQKIHIPCEINDLFINWKKDFYGFIYGNLTLAKFEQGNARIDGMLILKKSLLKDNIFSAEVSGGTYTPDYLFGDFLHGVDLQLKLLTESPIKVRTPTLETYADVQVKINYAHNDKVAQIPQIEGAIKLDGGTVTFLRNKLNIEYGRIQFLANQMNDPLIDLMIKNNINKYLVSLQATGSLQKPNIILESTPELTEEQILGLILAGSENATLQADLPGILMQNLNNIILGSKSTLPKTTTFFEKITRPLKYVHIAPHFTDQSGRGGIKGVVSVDVNKQLRAKIQKNFTLQEDFAFEVEYFLADDVNVKVVKDQRGEVGSEVELRFKF